MDRADRNLALAWARDRTSGEQTKGITWNVKKGRENAFRLRINTELRVSFAN